MSKWLRPALTMLLTIGLFAATTHMVLQGHLKADVYLTTWGGMVGMMVAFFFGERAALKTPGKEET